MTFHPLPLAGCYLIDTKYLSDNRGGFFRTFCKQEFAEINHVGEWVQCNHSITNNKAAIRGMHFQKHPYKEIKLVRCIAGAVHDVVIDIRASSPTFLQHVAVELSAANKRMLYIPEGFAHGFQALQDGCELIYHHTAFYTPQAEAGIRYNDPLIGIHWPLSLTDISERDNNHPYLDKDFMGI